MSQEWYLIDKGYNQLSGYEDELSGDYTSEGMNELFESSISQKVELYGGDMKLVKRLRVLVLNTVQDTKLKSLTRHMLFPLGTCKAGMYVKYKQRFWLIVGLVDDNTVYEKAILSLCNYNLTWLNEKGEVIQRWVNVTSASQYNNGETSTERAYYRTDQVMVLCSRDDESLKLPHGKRFVVDASTKLYEKEFKEKGVLSDTSKNLIVYKLTRMDDVLFDYIDSGYLQFIIYQDEQHENDGYYVVNGNGYWLCEVPKLSGKEEKLSCDIVCDEAVIYDGLEPTVFKAVFYDETGRETKCSPVWDIKCAFKEELEVSYKYDSIGIYVDNPSVVKKSFRLILSANGYKPKEITISIKAFM